MGTRVLLADDHRLVREGLRRTLEEHGHQVVAEAQDGDEAQRLTMRLRPDVALLDVSMPGADGLTVAARLRTRAPDTRVVILTMHDDRDLLDRARAAEVAGYLLKDASGDEVAEAVRRAHRGQRVVSSTLGARAPSSPPPASRSADGDEAPTLSDRERQILQLLADGLRPGEVADRLVISPKTVRNHLGSVYAKLGVGDRSQAILEGLRLGLVSLGDA